MKWAFDILSDLFFNPQKIGAYKMRITPPLRSVVFFNPLKIGAYKIEGRKL